MAETNFDGSNGGPLPRQACIGCGGTGKCMAFVDGPGFSGLRQLSCSRCGGLGTISAEHAERMRLGTAMRDARVAAGKTLLQAARERGIGPAELSKLERGEAPDV